MPKISVIMPVYNTQECWLREAIESILVQTFADFEFIIINDGSTNNVEDVILSYKDVRIRYFKKNNEGIAKTLNLGLNMAQGEYIARMDADDISLPERFTKQIEYFNSHPDISILGTSFEVFPNKRTIKHPANVHYLDLLRNCCVGHPTVMFKKRDFDKYNLKYDENYKAAQDYELWSRAIKHLKIANLQEILLYYRMSVQNITSTRAEIQSNNTKIIQQSILDFLTSDINLQNEINKLLFNTNFKPKNLNTSKQYKYTFIEKIFSVKNDNTHKVLTLLGVHMKFKRNSF